MPRDRSMSTTMLNRLELPLEPPSVMEFPALPSESLERDTTQFQVLPTTQLAMELTQLAMELTQLAMELTQLPMVPTTQLSMEPTTQLLIIKQSIT